ncbi:MAG: ABC transporter ATP-binding protein [Elusimicrobia bacterium]|nr:ABC transporter ATP-binding protein [Elusimicrobiota bacterium]MDY6040012.1 ABC transporter ATP-binding protein [Elusimicrobiaceae bacterium]
MNEPIIRVENLVIAFGNFKAVNGISFEVSKGEIFGFLGANGAGKTTTIRALCGILNPTSGRVFVNGKNVAAATSVLKPHIGYMSQKFTLYPDLTVHENMDLAGSLYGLDRPAIRQKSAEVFDFIGLKDIPKGPVKHLSGGVKQMIALASSILHDPELLFLDEPTAGTSPQTRAAFWNLICRLAANGKTVFVTTHYMDETEYCGRIVLMQRGRILALGTPEQLKERYFPVKPKELTFLVNKQQETAQEIKRKNWGNVNVFGSKLRVYVSNPSAFESFCQQNKEVFTCRDAAPSLDDVFLKAVSGDA